MAIFSIAYQPVKDFEHGYVNIINDSGGETYNGCARNFFSNWKGWVIIDREKSHPSFKQGNNAFTKHLDRIPELQLLLDSWYEQEWWNKLGLSALPQALANEIFEQTINLGKNGSGKLVQKMCNAFNYNPSTGLGYFTDLIVDGVIGPKTITALSIIIKNKTTEQELVHALNCLQGSHYINIANEKPSQRLFTVGWMKRSK